MKVDLTLHNKKTMEVKISEVETLQIYPPKRALLLSLTNADLQNTDVAYELTAQILSNNTAKKKFKTEDLENFPLPAIIDLLTGYLQFVNEMTELPN